MFQGTSLVLLVVALIVGVGVGIGLRMLESKFKTAPKAILNAADTVIDDVKGAADTVGKLLLPAPESALIDKILQAAQAGVHKAQQLFNSSQLTDDQRKQVAFNSAMNLLNLAGLKSSPELETAVNDAIESGVFVMKTILPAPSTPAVPVAVAASIPVALQTGASTDTITNPTQAAVAQAVQQEAQKASDQAVQGVIQQFTSVVQAAIQSTSVSPAAGTTDTASAPAAQG